MPKTTMRKVTVNSTATSVCNQNPDRLVLSISNADANPVDISTDPNVTYGNGDRLNQYKSVSYQALFGDNPTLPYYAVNNAGSGDIRVTETLK